MTKHKLMIKRHKDTNLKYLCYTKKSGKAYDEYLGSGIEWRSHLSEHGNNIETILIFESDDYNEFKNFAIETSIKYDVVNSTEWANLKIEEGDGGDTVSRKIWITDGSKDKYWSKDQELPEGWFKGRSNCIFNDSNEQRLFSKKRDTEKFSKSLKSAWKSGKFNKRDHSKCGAKGSNNVATRPEVKEKLRKSALNRPPTPCPDCGKIFKGTSGLTSHKKRSKDCK